MLPILTSSALGSIMGIDFGSKYIKATVATRNTTLHWALNEYGKRYMPHHFAFWNRTRLLDHKSLNNMNETNVDKFDFDFGFFAKDQCLKNYRSCVEGPAISQAKFNLKGHEITALSLINFINSVKKAENINDYLEITVAVPPGMNPKDKSLLLLAFSLANASIVQFIDATVAPSIQYSLEHHRDYENTTKNIAFVDIGATGSRVSIFNFNGTGENTATQLAIDYNHIGGDYIDRKIAEKIAKSNGINTENNPTLFANFMNDVSAAKELLSIHPSVDLKWDDDDYDEPIVITITRDDIIPTIQLLTNELKLLIQNVLQKSGLKTVDEVLLVGGASRMREIRITSAQEFNISEDNVSSILNQDSSIAFGAGYAMAERSKQYKVRPVTRVSMITTPILYSTNKRAFEVFSQGNTDDMRSTVQVKVKPGQRFFISNKKPFEEFEQFALDIQKETDVEISFVHNDYLMPIVEDVTSKEGNIGFNSIPSSWQPSQEELNQSVKMIGLMLDAHKERRMMQKAIHDLEDAAIRYGKLLNTDKFMELFGDRKLELEEVLLEVDNWLSSLRYEQPRRVYEERLQKLNETFAEIANSIVEAEALPTAIQKLQKTAGKIRNDVLLAKGGAFGFDANEADEILKAVGEAEEIKEGENSSAVLKRRMDLKERAKSLRELLKPKKKAKAPEAPKNLTESDLEEMMQLL